MKAKGQRPKAKGQRPKAKGQRPKAKGQRPKAWHLLIPTVQPHTYGMMHVPTVRIPSEKVT